MQKKKQLKQTSPEKLAKTQKLRRFLQVKFARKLKELEEVLASSTEKIGLTIEEAAQRIGATPQGIRDILATTHCSDIEIFSVQKEQKEVWYVRINKKWP